MGLVRDSTGRGGNQSPAPALAPLASPSNTANGYTAGATAAHIDGTSTGGIGTTAYTLGDLVAALKLAGVIKP